MNTSLMQNIKIYHTPAEVQGEKVTGFYLLLTEVCAETGKIIALYYCPLPVFVHKELFEQYKFYQYIFN